MKPPIIVGSAPSSGSTLLRVLLGRHPAIASGGEVALLDKRGLLMETEESYRASIAEWFDEGYPADFLGPSEELFEELEEYPWERSELREMCTSQSSLLDMLDCFYSKNVECSKASRWLDKCPSNLYCFDLISKLYPNARFIHIVRDARDCVVSYCRRGGSPFCAVGRWYFATLSGIQYRGWPNYLEIRYEDLVHDPEITLRQVCAFLDEPYMDCLTNPEQAPGDPRHAGWRHSAKGPIQAGSVKQFGHEMTDCQRAMFQHISLSPYGEQLLYRGSGAVGMLSPTALQEILGYDASNLLETPSLTEKELGQSWMEFERYRLLMLMRHGAKIECQLTLNKSDIHDALQTNLFATSNPLQ